MYNGIFFFFFFYFIFPVLWGLNFRIRTDIYAQTNSKQLGKKGKGECVEGQLLVFTCQLLVVVVDNRDVDVQYIYTYTYSIQRLIKIVKSLTLHIGFTFLSTETFFFICEKKIDKLLIFQRWILESRTTVTQRGTKHFDTKGIKKEKKEGKSCRYVQWFIRSGKCKCLLGCQFGLC